MEWWETYGDKNGKIHGKVMNASQQSCEHFSSVGFGPMENSMETRPLASICLTSYNQSAHICEAIDSALKQSYEKCEVVISDDCSTDDSDKVIREFIASYRASGGARSIIYHRNEHNLGIAKNYEKCFSLAHGELLITGSGDDLSTPDRASKIVAAWLESGKTATCIATGARRINEDGTLLSGDDFGWLDADHPIGALAAYDRRVITDFPEIEMTDAFEDAILTRRAIMLGDFKRISDQVVLYRQTGICSREKKKEGVRAASATSARRTLAGITQALKDLEFKRGVLTSAKYDELYKRFEFMRQCSHLEYRMITGGNIFQRLVRARTYMKCRFGDVSFFSQRFVVFVLPKILPKCVYDVLKRFVRRGV